MKELLSGQEANAIAFAETYAGSSIARSVARLYSHHTQISFGSEGLTSWTLEEYTHRIEDAEKLLVIGLALEDSADTKRYLRRAGEIFEWCINSSLAGEAKDTCIILASSSYLLAGYPARSSGVLAEHGPTGQTSRVLIHILRGQFRQALIALVATWNTSRPSTDQKTGHLDQILRALGAMMSWLQWGDEPRAHLAISCLKNGARALTRDRNHHSWLLAHSFANICGSFIATSLWTVLKSIFEQVSETGQQSLRRYIRAACHGNKSLAWPSQIAGIAGISSNQSFALCTPTGSGKTRVAELVILRHLFAKPSDEAGKSAPFILYLAPSRALSAIAVRLRHVCVNHAANGINSPSNLRAKMP